MEDFRDEIDRRFISYAINEILNTLTERESTVIKCRHMEEIPVKYKDIGKMFNVTASRARQIQQYAMWKLTNCFRRPMFLQFNIPGSEEWFRDNPKIGWNGYY